MYSDEYEKIQELQYEIDELKLMVGAYNVLSEALEIGMITCVQKDNLHTMHTKYINKIALNLLGLSREQFSSQTEKNFDILQFLAISEGNQSDINNISKLGGNIQFIAMLKRNENVSIEVSVGFIEVLIKGEKVCIFTFQNSKNLQKCNENLESSQDENYINLQSLAQNVGSGIVVCSSKEGFPTEYFNQNLSNMLGYTYEELNDIIKDGYSNLIYEGDLDFFEQETNKQLNLSDTSLVTYRLNKKNGDLLWVEDKGAIIESVGEDSIIQCIVSDITLRKKQEEALIISETRHKLVVRYSDISTFDYDIRSKKMTLHVSDSKEFDFPTVIYNAIETIVSSGMINQESIEEYKNLYRKIEAGEPMAKAIIHGKNAKNEECIFELSITNIFDQRGNQLLAVGSKKEVTEKFNLQREKVFADTLSSDKRFVCEANITKNMVIFFDYKGLEGIMVKDSLSNTYSDLVENICKSAIYLEDISKVATFMSQKNLLTAFEEGKRLICLAYRRKTGIGEYCWFNNMINIIKDELSGDIIIRSYTLDITETKEKEHAILEEIKFYEMMMSESSIVSTVNISKNKFVSTNEFLLDTYGINQNDDYDEAMILINAKLIHPDDNSNFEETFCSKKLLESYIKGNNKITCDCRILNESKLFIWVHCTMKLFKDSESDDIIGFSYSEDIDIKKRNELSLIYRAEHDALTDMYNKFYTEKYISTYLATGNSYDLKHAFLIIDIDRFKGINDNFGHAFGDSILTQIAKKVKKIFREDDILGRIGGDEFVVFMKNISTKHITVEKANELCSVIADSFYQDGVEHKLTISVGIAFYGKHGRTYDELYVNSDSALYASKERGRNCYTVFSKYSST